MFVPKGPIDNNLSDIDSDNGLAPIRRQAIIWTNADPDHWRIYVALEGNGLMSQFIQKTSNMQINNTDEQLLMESQRHIYSLILRIGMLTIINYFAMPEIK